VSYSKGDREKIDEALREFDRHQFADLTITKHNGKIMGFRIHAEKRFVGKPKEAK